MQGSGARQRHSPDIGSRSVTWDPGGRAQSKGGCLGDAGEKPSWAKSSDSSGLRYGRVLWHRNPRRGLAMGGGGAAASRDFEGPVSPRQLPQPLGSDAEVGALRLLNTVGDLSSNSRECWQGEACGVVVVVGSPPLPCGELPHSNCWVGAMWARCLLHSSVRPSSTLELRRVSPAAALSSRPFPELFSSICTCLFCCSWWFFFF